MISQISSVSWCRPMVLQEFGVLQTSLLKHNLRLKQKDSLTLDAVTGKLGIEVPQCGTRPSSSRGSELWGTKSPRRSL